MTVKNKSEKLRFGLVGAANTLIDFSVLFTLTAIGIPSLISNVFSTSCAFTFSFFANKNFTFKAKNTSKKQFLLFIVITLFGLWGIQTTVMWIMGNLLGASGLDKNLVLFISKLFATLASLVWNYSLYSRIVFKQDTD